MGPTDLAALRALAQQESWRVNALPPGVGIDELRILDADGLIEARAWVLQNLTRDPTHPIPLKPQPWPMGWVSPASKRDLMGSWSDILRDGAAKPETAAEVRVTDRGFAELARAGSAPVQSHPPAAPRTPAESVSLHREIDRFIRERLRAPDLRAAAYRLAHAVSDKAWWAKEVAEYRRRGHQYARMSWTREQKRAELRLHRPDRGHVTNMETARMRPYWRFAGHAALPVLDADAVLPPPRSATEAWDIALLFWVITMEDAPLADLGLDAIADWELGSGWGRQTFWSDVLEGLGGRATGAEALVQGRAREALTLLRDRAATPVTTVNGRPAPVDELIGRLSAVRTRSRWLRQEWVWAKWRNRTLPMPQDLPWQEVPWGAEAPLILPANWRDQTRDRAERIKRIKDCLWRVWAERLESLMWAVLQWRAAVDAAHEAAASVAEWTDDKRQPAKDRWTAGLIGELSELGGVVNRLADNNLPVTRGRDGPRTIKRACEALTSRLRDLRRIPGTAQPQGFDRVTLHSAAHGAAHSAANGTILEVPRESTATARGVEPTLVILDDGSYTVRVKGRTLGLTVDQWRFVQKVANGKGAFVKTGFRRPDRIRKALKPAIQRLIETERGPGGGFRIDPKHLT